jgi:hypothetical protein
MPDWKPTSFEPDNWKPSSFVADGPKEEDDWFTKLSKGGILDSKVPLSERLSDFAFGKPTDSSGRKIIGPPANDSLLPKNITGKHEPSSYWSGFGNSLYKDFVRPIVSDSGALGAISPSNRFSNPETYKGILRGEKLGLPTDPTAVPVNYTKQGAENAKLGLPAMGKSSAKRTFYNGPAGTTEAGKSYPIDIAPQTPRLGQKDAGTILPREIEGLSNLDPITAANRGTRLGDIQSIDKETPGGVLRSLDKVKNGEPMKMPVRDNEIGDITGSQGNIGDPSLPYQTPSAVREGKFKPQTFVPDTPKKGVTNGSIEPKQTATANLSQKDNTTGVPTPGQAVSNVTEPTQLKARSKDINLAQAEFTSVDKTLSSRPETKLIADVIIGAADQKAKWIATTERELASITSGLHKGELITLGDMVDKGIKLGDDPRLAEKATAIKAVLDNIHAELKIPTSITGGKIGYIENYLTHITKLPEDDLKTGIKQIWEYHVGKPVKDILAGLN